MLWSGFAGCHDRTWATPCRTWVTLEEVYARLGRNSSTDFHEKIPPLLPIRPVQGGGDFFTPDISLIISVGNFLPNLRSPGTRGEFFQGGGHGNQLIFTPFHGAVMICHLVCHIFVVFLLHLLCCNEPCYCIVRRLN